MRHALAGWPEIGTWDQMFPLLTVDVDEFPHVCLLSRTELEADAVAIRAVIASRNTSRNVQRSGRATLVVIGTEAAWYAKLTLVRSRVEQDGLLGADFRVASLKRDAAGVALRPCGFMPTAALRIEENWERSMRLLSELSNAGLAAPD
ncbi:MAG: hypothetical protein ACYC0H_08615 [Solirubrobacteraceae bacterium]